MGIVHGLSSMDLAAAVHVKRPQKLRRSRSSPLVYEQLAHAPASNGSTEILSASALKLMDAGMAKIIPESTGNVLFLHKEFPVSILRLVDEDSSRTALSRMYEHSKVDSLL
ncbi:hypothetical protein R1sor_026134 [Riccia sorocarpa]|uniref:Uncharacterized protein n=1 Tax=Riccia sorocarpa TaxID=122646 RepID=A0ABD3GC43_9MARC